MFKRRLVPVWIGIILLSGMFLMGQETWPPPQGTLADVQNVSVSGAEGAYTFTVTVSSPDTGCGQYYQYCDWFEVLTTEGELLFRRIIVHSHVSPPFANPFTRDLGPIPVQFDQTVIVRAHLSNVGYGGAAMRGSVESGFEPAPDITEDFAPEVETQDPRPFCYF